MVLQISTWMGVSLGAEHWYGRLSTDDGKRDERMRHSMTSEEAKNENKKDREMGQTFFRWKKGAMTQGYSSRQQIIDQAREEFKTFEPKATVLIEGMVGCGSPQTILEGPDWFKTMGNMINDAWPGWRAGKDEECERLGAQWAKLIERIEAEPKRKK